MSENENGKEKAMPASSTIDKDDAYERRRRIEAKEIEEELIEMSNLGMAVELKGIAIGRKQEKEELSLEYIRNVTHKLNLTTQQAMDILNIPKEEQAHYTSILDSDEHNQED
jgi:hypothetical protein